MLFIIHICIISLPFLHKFLLVFTVLFLFVLDRLKTKFQHSKNMYLSIGIRLGRRQLNEGKKTFIRSFFVLSLCNRLKRLLH